jgi:hypothetical protein
MAHAGTAVYPKKQNLWIGTYLIPIHKFTEPFKNGA